MRHEVSSEPQGSSRRRRWLIALFVLLSAPGPARGAEKAAALLITGGSALLSSTEAELATSSRYRLVLLQSLLPLMRQADEQAQVQSRAAALLEQGRQAMVALDPQAAQAKLSEAEQLLAASFTRYYDTQTLAQVHLLLGIISLEQLARPDLARQHFLEVRWLDPGLEQLDAHYSPRVRTAFLEAGRTPVERPAPSPADLRRLCALARSQVALVLSVQPAGDHSLLQGSLFDAGQGAYTRVDSKLVDPQSRAQLTQQAMLLGGELRRLLETRFPAPPPAPVRVTVKLEPHKIPPLPPRPRPWYLRWYTLAGVGAVIVAAIALPFALRQETVDVKVRWQP